MTIHYTYKTICLATGEYYYGRHSTRNLYNDGYLGSGSTLWRRTQKYGKDSFIHGVIKFYDTKQELIDAESTLLLEMNVLEDDKCLNLTHKSDGGIHSKEHHRKMCDAATKIKAQRRKDDPEFDQKIRESCTRGNNTRITRGTHKSWKDTYSWEGKHQTDEHKRKIGEANSIKQTGNGNSQFGTCWITDGTTNKKIQKSERHQYLDDGWVSGRSLPPRPKTGETVFCSDCRREFYLRPSWLLRWNGNCSECKKKDK